MSNMFLGKSKKKIPNTLNECVETDDVSNNLWKWAERLERWGFILFVVIIIYGFVEIISVLGVFSEIETTGEENIDIFGEILTCLFTYGIYAFLEYCAYHAIALLLGALASIVQNTNISANIALYSVKGKSGDKFTETENKKVNDNLASQTKSNQMDMTAFKDVKCPVCQKNICIPKNNKKATCPWCKTGFDINSSAQNTNKVSEISDEPNESYSDVSCPSCGKVLYLPKGATDISCPWCGTGISI